CRRARLLLRAAAPPRAAALLHHPVAAALLMRRAPLLALAFGLSLAASAAGQTPRVGLVVGLAPPAEPSGARRARVQVKDLLVDQRWLGALDQAFPIRLSFEMEIWRSRQVGPDDYQRTAQWSILVQRDLLEDQYVVTRILN